MKTTLAGQYNGHSDEYYGYSTEDGRYNSPEVLADNLKSVGISLVNIATNHALDSDAEGLVLPLVILIRRVWAHVGAAATADGSTDYTQNIDGVNIGFIGYTNSTNDLELASDAACVLNTLNNYDEQSVEILYMDFCNESGDRSGCCYAEFRPVWNLTVLKMIRKHWLKLCQAGADLIFGDRFQSDEARPKISVTDEAGGSTRNCLSFTEWVHCCQAKPMHPVRKIQISVLWLISVLYAIIFGETSIQSFTVTR